MFALLVWVSVVVSLYAAGAPSLAIGLVVIWVLLGGNHRRRRY